MQFVVVCLLLDNCGTIFAIWFGVKNEDIINNYRDRVKDATPESVLGEADATIKKVSGVKVLGGVMDKIMLAYGYVRDVVSGRYDEYSGGAMAVIVGGLAYLALPIDLVPDFIPVVGWFDDVIVLGWVFAQTASELDNYEKWRNTHALKGQK